jgi:cytochrome c oxidase subunit IV
VVSTTVNVWLQVEKFVHESVARQVRVAVNVRPQKPAVLVTVPRIWMATFVPSQMSLAEGALKFHGVPHSTITFAAQLKAGGVVSTTVMVWLQVEALVQESIALHVRVALNVRPQKPAVLVTVPTIWMVTFVPSQISFAVGMIKFQGVPHSTIKLAAQLRAGGVVSTTVMVWLQVEIFVQASIALHVRTALKVRPQKPTVLVRVLTIWIVTFVPLQTSFAVGAIKLQGVPHSMIRSDAQLRAGGVVSTTVMV